MRWLQVINIVISPSQQRNNRCEIGDSEQDHMYLIGQKVAEILKQYKDVNLYLIPKLSGDDNSNLAESVRLSNEFIKNNGGQGFHLSLHSDAGAYAKGATGIYFTEAGKAFMIPITKALKDLTPWEDVGLRHRADLYELKKTTAVAGLLEVSFHDNEIEAKWIHDNMSGIARAIVDGIVKALDVRLELDMSLDEALKVLSNAGIIKSRDYWMNNAIPGGMVDGTYANTMIKNMAVKLKEV